MAQFMWAKHGLWSCVLLTPKLASHSREEKDGMDPNPAVGVFYHWLGGLASASFYLPFRKVKVWAWETYWLVGGFFSWIIVPWVVALDATHDLLRILRATPGTTLLWTYVFGLLWGLGGLTFGLTMRYLGMSLGMAMVLGYTATFGTLVPPIFRGEFLSQVLGTHSGRVILLGVAVCLVGIVFAGAAGVAKERTMSDVEKRTSIREFDLKRGVTVATFSGIMSACFAYGLAAGDPIKKIAVRYGTPELWQGLPVLVVVLLGGFTTNFIWCVILNVRNRTGNQYFNSEIRVESDGEQSPYILENAIDAPGEEVAKAAAAPNKVPPLRTSLLANYFFSSVAGTVWYFQFFFYTMGETQMGEYKFSSWTLHMASIMIFGSLWGIALKEWTGAGGRAGVLLASALILLVGSTVVLGYGNYIGLAH